MAGCHASEQDAKDQLAALYANEGDMMEDSFPVGEIAFRTWKFEARILGEDTTQPRIEGYAALYNSNSEEMGFLDRFTERITPGAFDGVLSNDVRGLVNHDPNFVLGRTKSGTLRLSTDSRGLHSEIVPPNTQWARDLMISMKRGDIDQMSFGFTVAKGGMHLEDEGATQVIDRVGRLFDVSVVTFPAYPATSVSARAFMEKLSSFRSAPKPESRRSGLVRSGVTAVTLARLNRRLRRSEEFSLSLQERKTNGHVD